MFWWASNFNSLAEHEIVQAKKAKIKTRKFFICKINSANLSPTNAIIWMNKVSFILLLNINLLLRSN